MEELKKLLEMLEEKLAYAKRLIAEYDETMDYASHCNLLGFAEGIEFVMEEIEEMLEGRGHGSGVKGQGTSEGKGIGKSKSGGRGKDAKKVKGKIRG
jgi:hypothetical protein